MNDDDLSVRYNDALAVVCEIQPGQLIGSAIENKFHVIYGTMITIAVVNVAMFIVQYRFPHLMDPAYAQPLSFVITLISLWSVMTRIRRLKHDVYRSMKPVRQQKVSGHEVERAMIGMEKARQELGAKKWDAMTDAEKAEYVNSKRAKAKSKTKSSKDEQEQEHE